MQTLKEVAQTMIQTIITDNMPDVAVINALKAHDFKNRKIYLVAIGKAAWTMAKAASDHLGEKIEKGIVITKYDHQMGKIPRIDIFEAGHPVLDENTLSATQKALDLVENLTKEDEVLFLISGGGSALFEMPKVGITLDELATLTDHLLASGADIVEINMIRKRLSKVKAGHFAKACQPARVFAVVLSDVLGDRLDMIASGPAAPDMSTTSDVLAVVKKYQLDLTPKQLTYLSEEPPKQLDHVKTVVTGSVKSLCQSASTIASALGFTPYILTTTLNCEAREAGRFLASVAVDTVECLNHFKKPCAIIAGGETVVTLKGKGLGGRNQELALSAATGISGLKDVLIFSLGSDGTDGPTDAAGGLVDGATVETLKKAGYDIDQILANNDAYHGLQASGGLIVTGPTGTNVNDIAIILCK